MSSPNGQGTKSGSTAISASASALVSFAFAAGSGFVILHVDEKNRE
jgi:hypothetical protein